MIGLAVSLMGACSGVLLVCAINGGEHAPEMWRMVFGALAGATAAGAVLLASVR